MAETSRWPSALPPLYAGWIDALLEGPIPPEENATCGDCAMRPDNTASGERVKFHVSTKCCTYLPSLANFLAGRVLSDADPAMTHGRVTLAERIERGNNVTPLGVGTPRQYQVLYGRSDAFGMAPSMRCPHYIDERGGLCGVWKHRSAICSTWFCKHVRGAVGLAFWKSLEYLLATIEGELAWWNVVELNPGPAAFEALLALREGYLEEEKLSPEDLDGVVEPAARRRYWGTWVGREEEFYRECAARVNALEWTQVLAICGPAVRAHASNARDKYGSLLSDRIPERLEVGPFKIIQSDGDRFFIDSYRGYDPLLLSRRVFQLLPEFDGRPTEEVLAELPEKHGVRMSPGLVRKLVDFAVLEPADAPARPADG
jgi:hypothetical protein